MSQAFRFCFLALGLLFPALHSAAQERLTIIEADGGYQWPGHVASDAAGGTLLGGHYSGSLDWGGTALPPSQGQDPMLLRADAEGAPLWAWQASGPDDDALSGIGLHADTLAYAYGQFWTSLDYPGGSLANPQGSRGIFLAAIGPTGQTLWAHSLNGSTLTISGGMAVDPAGNAIVTGYFSDSLFLADTVLVAASADAFFLAKFSPQGERLWAMSGGNSGAVRGQQVLAGADGRIYLLGELMGSLNLGGQNIGTIAANFNSFLAAFDAQGQPLWLRRMAGAYENRPLGLLAHAGELLVAGRFVGPIDLGEGIQAQTEGFLVNPFIARYSAAGQPLWVQALGHSPNHFPAAFHLHGEEACLGGAFVDALQLGGMGLSGGPQPSGYVAAFAAADGSARWLRGLQGGPESYVLGLASGPAGLLVAGTAYGSLGTWGSLPPVDFANAAWAGFLWQVASPLVSAPSPSLPAGAWRAAPNPLPAGATLHWPQHAERAELYDAQGRQVAACQDCAALPSGADWPAGLYVLCLRQNGQSLAQKLWLY